MTREYTSAARRAAVAAADEPLFTGADPAGLLAWVGVNTDRAREALRRLQLAPWPDGVDVDAARAQREQLADRLRDVFPDFIIDGVRFHVMGSFQLLDLCELMRLGKKGARTDDPVSLVALADFFRGALGEAEYERFRDHCRENNTDADMLNSVMEGVVEDLSDRPTSPPAPSQAGPSTTGPTSRVVSLSGPQPGVRAVEMTPEQFAAWEAEQRRQLTAPASFG